MTFDVRDGLYIVRNPLSQKKKRFSDEAEARKVAAAVNALVAIERQRKALADGRPTIAGLADKWLADKLRFMPWSEGTRTNYVAKFNRIRREDIGQRAIAHTDCMFIEEWITSFVRTADTFNDWRYVFVLLWSFAVSRNLAATNEAEKIEERSTSKKIESNRKQREQLDIAGFHDIHAKAPAWLQLGMEQSLVTLQARLEICSMMHAHYRDGFLYVIRHKVAGDSEMAFIRIALTEQLEELRQRSRRLLRTEGEDDVHLASPYLIHRSPERLRREWIDGKPHWSYINPDYLSKAFAEARDQVARFAAMPPRQRPTFHEVRGLGGRIYLEQGVLTEAQIQALMTHSDPSTTQIYLERGAKALTDANYHAVAAPLVLRDVMR